MLQERECIETVEGSRHDIDSGFVTKVHLDETIEVYLYGDGLCTVPVVSVCSQHQFVSQEYAERCVMAAQDEMWADPFRH